METRVHDSVSPFHSLSPQTTFSVGCESHPCPVLRLWRKPVCSDFDAYTSMCYAAENNPALAKLPLEIVVENMNQAYNSGEVYTPTRPFWGMLFTNCKRIVYEAW